MWTCVKNEYVRGLFSYAQPDLLRYLELDLTIAPTHVGQDICDRLHIPIRRGMHLNEVELALGMVGRHLSHNRKQIFARFVVGDQWIYQIDGIFDRLTGLCEFAIGTNHPMKSNDFLRILERQNKIVPWLHTIGTGLTSDEHDTWSKRHTHIALPGDLLGFLSCANGVGIEQGKVAGEWIGHYASLLALREITSAEVAIYGQNPHRFLPDAWCAIGYVSDSVWFLVWDSSLDDYWAVPPIALDEAEYLGKGFSQALGWFSRFIPSDTTVYQKLDNPDSL